MREKKSLRDLLIKKDEKNEIHRKILEKHREIYNLFVRASKKEELQEVERWLLR